MKYELNITPAIHPGLLRRRKMASRDLSANRLAINLGVPSGRITDILHARRSITADTALRLGRYFGNSPQFWLDLQGQYDIVVVELENGEESRSACIKRMRLETYTNYILVIRFRYVAEADAKFRFLFFSYSNLPRTFSQLVFN